MTTYSHLTLYTDGSLTPQGAGAGVIILDVAGKLVCIQSQSLEYETNNEAEYAALVLGFQQAVRLNAEFIEVRADSEVMVEQMRGNFAVKSHRLKQIHWQTCQLARQFVRVRYTCIPREHNALADALAAEAAAGREWLLRGA